MLSISLALTACQNLEKELDQERVYDKTITFSVSDFEINDSFDTRTAIVSGNKFIWTANDTVGIFPNNGSQVFFEMTSGAGANTATFDGGGWDFKPSAVYRSYYPLIGEFYLDQTNIPVCFIGQKQVGNDNSEGIGPFDFMYTPATSAENGNLKFSYRHLCTIIKVKITLPEGHYNKVMLMTGDPVLVENGHYDLTATQPEIIGDTFSQSLSIDLDIDLPSNTQLVACIMCAPFDISGKTLTVVASDNQGYSYSGIKSIPANYPFKAQGIYPLNYSSVTLGPAPNEIWYKSVDNVEIPYAQGQDATVNQLVANIPPSADNDNWGIMRFAAPVTETDYRGFNGAQSLLSVKLPVTLETINTESFVGCNRLETIELGPNLKTIKGRAFMSCRGLKNIHIPESVTSIGSLDDKDYLLTPFYQCPSLESFSGKYASSDGRSLVVDGLLLSFAPGGMRDATYFVPSDVQHIGHSAFFQADFSGIVLPEGLITIQDLAFAYNSRLKSVTIPSTVEALYFGAFQRCSGLDRIEIKRADHVLDLRQSAPHSYYSYNVFFETNNCPIYVPNNLLDSYTNGAPWDAYGSLCETGNRYFSAQQPNEIWYKTNDGSVAPETLPDGFSRGADLQDGTKVIKYGSNITEIPDDFFSNASNLTEVFLPSEVVSIGNYAFANCQNLKNVHFGNKLTTIGMNAFQSCISLKSIDLPESLTTLSTHAFYNCSKITTVRIPDALTLVSDNPFYMCDGLSSFTGTNNMISEDGRCLVKNGTIVSFATAGLEDQIYTIPEGITSIGNQAFVKANFSSVIIPETVNSIGWAAFYDNTHLTTIDIPSSVTSMSSWVFNECSALYKVTLHNTTPPTLGKGVFNGTNSSLSIFVPAGSVEAYKTNSSWIAALSSVDVIQAIPTE